MIILNERYICTNKMILEVAIIINQISRIRIKNLFLSYKTDFNQYFSPQNGTNFR